MEFLIFFLLRLSVVICGCLIGKKVSIRLHKNYLLCVLPFIIVFALNEGLRFGRGVDYNNYYYKYNSILEGDTSNRTISDPIFVAICHINDFWGLPYQGLVFILSLILAVSGIILLKKDKNVLQYAFPLFFLYSLPAENLMRWYLAYSFLLIAVYYYNNNNLKTALVFAVFAIGSHLAISLIVILLFLIKQIKRPLFNQYMSIGIYLFLWLFFSTDMMLGLVGYINNISFLSDYYIGYINNADVWLTGTGLGDKAQNFGIGLALPDILTIFLAYKVMQKYPNTIYYCNIFVVGTLLSSALMRIELGYRIAIVLKLFQCIVLAYAFKDYLFTNKRSEAMMKIVSWIIVLNIIRVYFLMIFTDMGLDEVLYIWDSNGKSVLL